MGDKASPSNCSPASSSLAPGFRFHPTDEELVIYYLKRKICGKPFIVDAISEIDIYKLEPWDLPDRSRLKTRDLEWYFFSALDKKYGNGWRTNRATDQGYWKTTGKDRAVRRGENTVGMKKTLVFHLGRAPHGERTNWVMHEYRLVDEGLTQAGFAPDAFVLCRVFCKSGPGPKNGEKYGAPFIEEEWDDNVMDVKTELHNEAYGCAQPLEQYDEDQAQAIVPQNDYLAGTDVGDGSNNLGNIGGSIEDDQKVFTGTSENGGLLELPEEKVYMLPQQFEMDQAPNENEYFVLEDFLGPWEDSNHADDSVDGELMYKDASQDPHIDSGSFLAVNDPSSSDAEQNPFEMLDEYLNYFDAVDDSQAMDLNSSLVLDSGVPFMNQPVLLEEVNAQNEQTHLPPPETSKRHGHDGASSSEKKPKLAGDEYSKGWDIGLAKQVSRMLDSIPAPTAFADEVPTKEAAFGQNSATHSSTSVHVTAGIIHISGMSVIGSDSIWSVGKSGNAELLLPYSSMRNVNLMSSFFEPMGSTWSSKSTTVILRSGLYFMFIWVLILSAVSCKIGSYIYTR